MVSLIYKAYYIFYLHFSKDKNVAWHSSIMAISGSLIFILISIFNEVGLLEKIDVYLEADTALGRRINIMIYFIVPLCVVIIYIVHYLVFNRAKASKKTGLSELYPFVPTKRDKVVHWIVWLGLFVFSFAPTIKRMLMEGS